jgi:hypothetical protein
MTAIENVERAILATIHWSVFYNEPNKDKLISLNPEIFTTELHRQIAKLWNKAFEKDIDLFPAYIYKLEKALNDQNDEKNQQEYLDWLATNPVPVNSMLELYKNLEAESIHRELQRKIV